jgi:hypothetical protein
MLTPDPRNRLIRRRRRVHDVEHGSPAGLPLIQRDLRAPALFRSHSSARANESERDEFRIHSERVGQDYDVFISLRTPSCT